MRGEEEEIGIRKDEKKMYIGEENRGRACKSRRVENVLSCMDYRPLLKILCFFMYRVNHFIS